jgi:ribose transport system permease protein
MEMPLEALLPAGDRIRMREFARHWRRSQEVRLLAAILLGGLLLCAQSSAFLTPGNLRSLLVSFSFVAIATLGQLLVILPGRIDLSSGSIMGLSGMVTALALEGGAPPALAILSGFAVGGVVGLLNGFLSSFLGISSFIVTLGTLQIARGVAVSLANGESVSGFSDSFLALGSTHLLPIPVWTLVAVASLVAACLRYTVFGRELYAIGGNQSAAELAGVSVKRVLLVAFVANGSIAGLAGILMTARLGAALGNAATGYELTIIASVVIGGTSLAGGKGGVAGALLGAMLIALVNNALVLLTVPTYWQQTFIGVVILCAALVDRIRR